MATVTQRPRTSAGRGVRSTGRSRKSPLSVDTDCRSYDRSDPFLAFDVLRKLLSALATRMGGCQYKMSPDEHKLSIHLLGIVEPFVGLSPSRRTIMHQPTEILDNIVSHIDSKRDLLCFGLSCRRLCTIIFPRHYDYRVIRCKISSIRVWNHLIVHRSLARNVRHLVVLDSRSNEPELVPAAISSSDTDLESTDEEIDFYAKQERFLCSALVKMSTLHSFSWACSHSPVSIDLVWPTVLKCHSLKEIDIRDNILFKPLQVDEDDGVHPPHEKGPLLDLKAVALRSTKHVHGSTKLPELSRISGMLDSCPNIESINIGYEHRRGPGYLYPAADILLLCSRWPHLTSLTLTNLHCSSTAGMDATASFLSSHSSLEVLHLDLANNHSRATFVLLPRSLPRLRELRSTKEIANAILECPCEAPRPLETIKGVKLTGSSSDSVFFSNLKRCGTTMKKIELAGWREMEDIKRLVECVPNLTWLDVGKKIMATATTGKVGPVVHANVVEWLNILTNLPELTAFHGVSFFHDVANLDQPAMLGVSDRSKFKRNDGIASLFAWKLPKLRRLDHWEEGSNKIIVLLRKEGENVKYAEMIKYEVRRIKT